MRLQRQLYFKYLNYDLCRYVNFSVNPIVFTWEIQLWKIIFFWHIGIVSQNQYPHHLDWTPSSWPKATKLTKLYCNNSLTHEFIEAIFKSRYFWVCSINPNCSEKQLSSVPRTCPCYKWYVFNILISITYHKHKYYSVCRLIVTVPWNKRGGHTWRIALNPRLLQISTCLGPQDQVTSVFMFINRFLKWFSLTFKLNTLGVSGLHLDDI